MRVYARARVRPYVRTYVVMCTCMHACVGACARACVVGHGTALHGLYGVLCIVAMQGSVRGAPTHRHALNPRAGVTMHDAYGNSRLTQSQRWLCLQVGFACCTVRCDAI